MKNFEAYWKLLLYALAYYVRITKIRKKNIWKRMGDGLCSRILRRTKTSKEVECCYQSFDIANFFR